MLGAIAGDIAGSIYENRPTKSKDIELFGGFSTSTDDTVLTVAVADAILETGIMRGRSSPMRDATYRTEMAGRTPWPRRAMGEIATKGIWCVNKAGVDRWEPPVAGRVRDRPT